MIKDKNIDINAEIDPAKIASRYMAKEMYVALSTGNMYGYLANTKGMKVNDKLFLTISAGYAAMTTGRNDTLFLSPDSHTQTAKLTWAKSLCHLIGQDVNGYLNQRSRIGHSASYATMLDVTGDANTFANLYFMYGLNSASNTNLLKVTGNRNKFVRCHFGGPMHATVGDQSTFDLVQILGSENYFEDCVFGITTIPWTDGDMISFGGTGYDPRTVFRGCTFLMNADNAQVNFIETVAGVGESFAIFDNCLFLNIGTSLTYGIDGAGTGAQKIAFRGGTYMAGVTDVVALAYEGNVFLPAGNTTAAAYNTALANGMAVNPDVS